MYLLCKLIACLLCQNVFYLQIKLWRYICTRYICTRKPTFIKLTLKIRVDPVNKLHHFRTSRCIGLVWRGHTARFVDKFKEFKLLILKSVWVMSGDTNLLQNWNINLVNDPLESRMWHHNIKDRQTDMNTHWQTDIGCCDLWHVELTE